MIPMSAYLLRPNLTVPDVDSNTSFLHIFLKPCKARHQAESYHASSPEYSEMVPPSSVPNSPTLASPAPPILSHSNNKKKSKRWGPAVMTPSENMPHACRGSPPSLRKRRRGNTRRSTRCRAPVPASGP